MSNEQKEPQSFADFLAEFAHGSVNSAATEKLKALVAACVETGRKGSITIKVDVGVEGKLASLNVSLKTNKPEAKLPGQVFFTTEEGDLHTEDPRQMKLPAKILDVPTTNKLKSIDGGNGQ